MLLLLPLFSLWATFSPLKIQSSSDPIGPWSTDTALPYALAGHSSSGFKNKLYAVTGSAQTFNSHNEVIFSIPGSSGSLSNWSYIQNYPAPMIWNSGTATSNFVYILGGFEEYSSSNKYSNNIVYFNSGGTLDPWTSANPLPQRLSKGAAVVVGDYIYFTGGWTDAEGAGTASNKTYYAHINADGSLGSWGTTSDLPSVWWDHRAIEYGGYIYVVGGWNSSGVTNRVLRAKPNPDGTLSGWSDMPALPTPVRAGGVTRAGNFAFVVGGFDGGNLLNTVYYTTIDSNGQMAAWQSEDNLPFSHCCGALAEAGGYLYLTGGVINDYTNQVYRAQITALTPPLPDLIVPDIKQYAPPWNDNLYDQASTWSDNPTIARWGCALTSAAMVLQFHGHNVNPDTLNDWLKSQTDGYIRNGLLNWLAVSRYTRLNASPTSPTLEYRRLGSSLSNLEAELVANRPAILAQPGHFVVGKSQTVDSFGINDPAFADRTTLSAYGNSFLSLGSYRPTHTDLSYLMLVVNAGVDLSFSDPAAVSYLEQPLNDDGNQAGSSGETVRILLLPQPDDGDYTAAASGTPGVYTLETYFYDPNGEVTLATQSGILTEGKEDNWQLTVGNEPRLLPEVTVATIIADWQTAYDQGLITKASIFKSVKKLLQAAEKLWQFRQAKAAKRLLKASREIVKKSQFIDSQVKVVMLGNISMLIDGY